MKNFHRNLISFRAACKTLIAYQNETDRYLPRVAAMKVVAAIFERLEKDGYSIVKLEEIGWWCEDQNPSKTIDNPCEFCKRTYRIIDRKEELKDL